MICLENIIVIFLAALLPCTSCDHPPCSVEALHRAAERNDLKAIAYLLDHGVDVNSRDEQGRTALHITGSAYTAEFLLARGADINATDNSGATPLLVAAIGPSPQLAELLISKGADIHRCNQYGDTPLHCAAYAGTPRIIKMLLDRGADINAVNKSGKTPIFEAIENHKAAAVALLIQEGADLAARKVAAFCSDSPLEAALVPEDRQGSFFYYDNIIQLLVQAVDVTKKDEDGDTVLLRAVKRVDMYTGYARIIPALIKRDADVNATNNIHATPLFLAVLEAASCNKRPLDDVDTKICNIYHKIILQLLSAGADVNIRDFAGRTALTEAKEGNLEDIVSILRKKGAVN